MSDARVSEAEIVQTVRRLTTPGPQGGVAVGIGDDCAVLQPEPGRRLVATTDLLLEDVHFRRRWAEPADIGWKALAVNLSDIASMGGRPRWALVGLAVPGSSTLEEVESFFEGAQAIAGEHLVALIGGDTSSSPAGWFVNVTLLGDVEREPCLRSGARRGDVIAVTGALGRAAAGLSLLEQEVEVTGAALEPEALADLTGAHLRPWPRVREGQWLGGAGGVTAMMDLSDGLATDLRRLAEESRVGAAVRLGRLPVDVPTRKMADALGRDALMWATSGGEDYELLLTCEADAFERLRSGLAQTLGTRLTAIGEVTPAAHGLRFLDSEGRSVAVRSGYEHFGGTHTDG